MRRLEVLFLPHPVAAIASPWTTDVIEAVSARHNLRVFDRTQPVAPQMAGIEAIVDLGGNISPELLAAAADAGVKFLQVQTTGLDHVDVEGILSTGLLLAHCPGQLSSVALAQSAMMFILMHAHRYGEARRNFDAGKMYVPTGVELEGLTLGLIGFGASAQDLARRAKPFGLRLLAIDIRPIEEEILAEIQPDFLGGPEDVDRVVAESDYLSLHLHLTPETRHTIDARRIGLMKETACLINVARGALVDEDALYEALVERPFGWGWTRCVRAGATRRYGPCFPIAQCVCHAPHRWFDRRHLAQASALGRGQPRPLRTGRDARWTNHDKIYLN